MTVIELQAARLRRAARQDGGVKRIGRTTEIIDPQSCVTCACGCRFKGRSVIFRNPDGFIGNCPDCLGKESKAVNKGETMNDTGVGDDHMPCKLTVEISAKTPAAVDDALAALHGLARDKHVTLAQGTPIVRRDFSICVEFETISPLGEEEGEEA